MFSICFSFPGWAQMIFCDLFCFCIFLSNEWNLLRFSFSFSFILPDWKWAHSGRGNFLPLYALIKLIGSVCWRLHWNMWKPKKKALRMFWPTLFLVLASFGTTFLRIICGLGPICDCLQTMNNENMMNDVKSCAHSSLLIFDLSWESLIYEACNFQMCLRYVFSFLLLINTPLNVVLCNLKSFF